MGMISELKEDLNESAMEVVMPDLIKMAKPFVKPAHKQFSQKLGADDRMFLIRKVLNDEETKLASELASQIEALRLKEEFHIDIPQLETKRNLLGTIVFYVVESNTIEQFELTGPPAVEFPIIDPDALITGFLTGFKSATDKA